MIDFTRRPRTAIMDAVGWTLALEDHETGLPGRNLGYRDRGIPAAT